MVGLLHRELDKRESRGAAGRVHPLVPGVDAEEVEARLLWLKAQCVLCIEGRRCHRLLSDDFSSFVDLSRDFQDREI